jgi:hypothetical protein
MKDKIKIAVHADEHLIEYLQNKITDLERQVEHLKDSLLDKSSVIFQPDIMNKDFNPHIHVLHRLCRVESEKCGDKLHVLVNSEDHNYKLQYFISEFGLLSPKGVAYLLIDMHKQLITKIIGDKVD